MALVVIDAGLSTTIQDLGRPGYREWGVPPAGVFDRRSAGLANALVGNDLSPAVLEFTIKGGRYQARAPLPLALAGAPMPARIIRPAGPDGVLTIPQSFTLLPDECLELGTARTGVRTYLAVRGGWHLPHVLESASTETPLVAAVVLEARPGQIARRRPAGSWWNQDDGQPIRIIDGPDSRCVSEQSPQFWRERAFHVSPNSNRMGLRLVGTAIDAHVPAERLSIPVCPGAIQLAGDQLIVLGIACGTMGGYPVIASVISADIDRLAQLGPAQPVLFERVTLEEARELDRQSRSILTRTLITIAAAANDDID
jgi:biotin-dependent carboxylase-like uncharacterized protein